MFRQPSRRPTRQIFMIRNASKFPPSRLFSSFVVGLSVFVPLRAQTLPRSEISVQYFGSFVSSTQNRDIQQSATDGGGILANYRYFFNDYNGIEFNYGASRNTQKFLADPFRDPVLVGVPANNHEATASYVVRLPKHRIVPFALAGVGGLIFDPRIKVATSTNFGPSVPVTVQARIAFVYGAGIDVNVMRHAFLRAQFRGFVYTSPDFNTFVLTPDQVKHRAEPSVGLGIRF